MPLASTRGQDSSTDIRHTLRAPALRVSSKEVVGSIDSRAGRRRNVSPSRAPGLASGPKAAKSGPGARTGGQSADRAPVVAAVRRGRRERTAQGCAAAGAQKADSSGDVEAIVNANLHTTPADATNWS